MTEEALPDTVLVELSDNEVIARAEMLTRLMAHKTRISGMMALLRKEVKSHLDVVEASIDQLASAVQLKEELIDAQYEFAGDGFERPFDELTAKIKDLMGGGDVRQPPPDAPDDDEVSDAPEPRPNPPRKRFKKSDLKDERKPRE